MNFKLSKNSKMNLNISMNISKIMGYVPNPRRWTISALECYIRGCNCDGCFYQNYLTEYECQMKATVLKLVKMYGIPTEKDLKRIKKGKENE